MPLEESTELTRELESMSKLWRAFLARMFLDVLDHRARIRKEASDFWADEAHFNSICEMAMIEPEPMSDCYDHLWTLPVNKRMSYAALVRDALTKGLLLPTPSKMARAERLVQKALEPSRPAEGAAAGYYGPDGENDD